MLARDWYYTERRRVGIDSAVASLYDRHDNSDSRANAALTMLGVKKGWRVADIDATRTRLLAGGINVSEVRAGRKPGTRVLSVRDGACGIHTLLLERTAKA